MTPHISRVKGARGFMLSQHLSQPLTRLSTFKGDIEMNFTQWLIRVALSVGAVIGILGLSGCASRPTYYSPNYGWIKEHVTREEYKNDVYECVKEATYATGAKQQAPAIVTVTKGPQQYAYDAIYRSCLRSKGYHYNGRNPDGRVGE